MHGVTMADFSGADPGPVEGRCRVCGAYIGPTARYCKRHMVIRRKARAQVERLCELAEERRVRRMIHEWWEVTG